MTVQTRPTPLSARRSHPPRRLRGDATYLYRHAKVSAGAAATLLRLRLPRRPPRA